MKFYDIPVPLQQAVFARLGLTVAALIAGVGILALTRNPTLPIPLTVAALLLGISAYRIYHMAAKGRYIVLRGIVLNVEQTLLRHRPKALLLEVEGKALHLILHNRRYAPHVGNAVELFIPDTAVLYEWRGMHRLETYFALTQLGQGTKK